MTLPLVNPLGWALFEELTSAQMNALQQNMVRAIDGQGGEYTLTAPLIIHGDVQIDNLDVNTSVTITGPLTVPDDLTVTGDVDVTGTDAAFDMVDFLVEASNSIILDSANTLELEATNLLLIESLSGSVTIQSGASDVNLYASSGTVDIGGGDISISGSDSTTIEATNALSISTSGATADVDISSGANGDIIISAGSDVYLVGDSIDAGSAISFILPGQVTKSSGAYIEYNSNVSIAKRFFPSNIITLEDSPGWVVTHTGISVDTYDGRWIWFNVPLPTRCENIRGVSVLFSADTAPSTTGLSVGVHRKTNWSGLSQLGTTAEQGPGDHVGNNYLITGTQGLFALDGSTDLLMIQLIAPVGGTGVNLVVHAIEVELDIAGMGSW